MKQLLQARRMRESIDQSFPPIVLKKEKLLNSCELFVGIVDVSVRADFGLDCESEKEDYLYLWSCFLVGF